MLRKADGLGFEVGADWREDIVGTNGVGTAAVTRRPVQVFAAERFVHTHATWTCAGAPDHRPARRAADGVVDVSGPLETMYPATLSWVSSVAKLAEAALRELHARTLEGLRAVAAPVAPGSTVRPWRWTATAGPRR
ncbi:GAF domain-containing protein OS=Streptomyces fumanus OX=67302 GN=GCM10018772_40210 PE=4 SV=1 [Streptomyces fumanus]